MRGQQSLFSDLFSQQSAVKTNRPRNYFQPERNEALLHRYYFHAEINRYRYDDCIAMLEREFYLTAPRIIVILTQYADKLSIIASQQLTVQELSKKFPHFNWRVR